jgi:hypothetical protein
MIPQYLGGNGGLGVGLCVRDYGLGGFAIFPFGP